MTGTRNARASAFERDVVRLLVAQQMALQLDADVASAEEADERDRAGRRRRIADASSSGTAGERHEAGGVALELLERQRALPFRAAPRIFMRVTRRQRFR